MSASAALQQAVFAALAADTALAALIGDRLHDGPPRAAAFPYVSLGEASALDWSTATEDGTEHRFTLHAWSRAGGKAEAHAILARLRAVLHDRPLAVDGAVLVNLRLDLADIRRDPDRLTWHAVARFRAVTEPAA